MTSEQPFGDEWDQICGGTQEDADAAYAARPTSSLPDQWRCMHAPECEERFDTLDALNKHLDGTLHDCCQVHSGGLDANSPGAVDGNDPSAMPS